MLRLYSVILLLISFPNLGFSEVGFRDLKIGQSFSSVMKNCDLKSSVTKCYDLDHLEFKFLFQSNTKFFYSVGETFRDIRVGDNLITVEKYCERISGTADNFSLKYICYNDTLAFIDQIDKKTLSMSVITPSDVIADISINIGPLSKNFLDKTNGNLNNPYIKLKKTLDSKYEIDWQFTERDRKFFNEGENDSLWTSYNKGQIFSEIKKIGNDKLRLFVHYHTKEDGERLTEERKPKNVKFNNF